MCGHLNRSAHRIMCLDRSGDRRMLANHADHPALLRQCHATIAIYLDLDLPNKIPNAGETSGVCDSSVEQLISAVKCVPIFAFAQLALFLDNAAQCFDLAARCALSG